MRVEGTLYRTIRRSDDRRAVEVIDQTHLPHGFVLARIEDLDSAAIAIRDMQVRGAPLIGVTAAYGVALAMQADPSDAYLEVAIATLAATRPTAVNLRWALDAMRQAIETLAPGDRAEAAFGMADRLADDDVDTCRRIGEHGVPILRALSERSARRPVNVLTHCNAGWLATVDWGTATSPLYQAHDAGIAVHVWVDETRPRNQGAALTAWELGQHGVPHTVIVDNAGGHLMQQGLVDVCLVGTDRTTAHGHVANKIGTYLKALAAKDNGVPFYVALPSSTIDWSLGEGVGVVPIEERDPAEVTHIAGRSASGTIERVRLTPEGSRAANYAFDVTPARLVTGLITERGVAAASREGLRTLFPEQA